MARSRFPGRQKGSVGSIVLGTKIMIRKRKLDVERTDPKLRTRTTVNLLRDASLDNLGRQFSPGRAKPNLRKKSNVIQSESLNSQTLSTLRKSSVGISSLGVGRRITSKRSALPVENTITSELPAKRQRKPSAILLAASKQKIRVQKKRKMRRQRKVKVPSKLPSRVKKLSISFSTNSFLVTLVRKFQITMNRDPEIEALAETLKAKYRNTFAAGQIKKVIGYEEQEDDTGDFNPYLDPVSTKSPEKDTNTKSHEEFLAEDKIEPESTTGIETQPLTKEEERFDEVETQLLNPNRSDRIVHDSDEQDDSMEGAEADINVIENEVNIDEIEEEPDEVEKCSEDEIVDAEIDNQGEVDPVEEEEEEDDVDDIEMSNDVVEIVSQGLMSVISDEMGGVVDTTTDDLDLIPDWGKEHNSVEQYCDEEEEEEEEEETDDDVIVNGNGLDMNSPDSSTRHNDSDPVPFIDFGKQIRNALSVKQSASK